MAGFPELRALIDLIEGKKNKAPQQPWSVQPSTLFAESLVKVRRIFPDIDEKLKKFTAVKLPNPLDPNARYGKHDRPMTGPLAGFMHCHLRDDAILIYTLQNRTLNLIIVVSHDEIDGGKLRPMAARLKPFLK
jgi:mRNA-degrading endonuclease YafQ of YafQ-DinJ toxin-antitoxin module